MKMIIRAYRSLVVISLVVFFGLGALFERYLMFPLQKNIMENYKTLQKSWKIFIWLLETFKIIKIKSDDIEKLKNIKNSIIVSTHPSFIDIIILMSIIPNSTCYVAERLANNPFLKGIVKLLFIIESSDNWISQTKEKIDDGLNVIIFPMGIRHRKNEYPKIRRGAALLAQKTEANIVTINMETTYDFLFINKPIYDAGEETVIYSISYLGEINTKEFLNEYTDEVSFRTKLTKKIGTTLYRKQ